MALSVRLLSKAFLVFTALGLISLVVVYQSPIKMVVINQKLFSSLSFVSVSTSSPVCAEQLNASVRVSDPYNAVEVHVVGSILDRVRQFNVEMDGIRKSVWIARGHETPWKFESISPRISNSTVPRRIVAGSDDAFLLQMSNFTEVTTVVLPWVACGKQLREPTEADGFNLLVKNYYIWSATQPLCSWIASKKPINNLKYNMLYREDCNTNLSADVIERARSLPRVFLNAINANRVRFYVKSANTRSTESDFYENSPPITFFCHVFHDAILTDIGDVFTRDIKLVPFGCSDDHTRDPSTNAYNAPLHDEVFSITQYWGAAVFHRMIEIMPRVVLYRDFLNRNPQIRILGPEGHGGRLAQLLQILGLDPGRLVTGWVRAKVAYLPRPSMCGMASVPEIQILSSIYRRYIVDHLVNGSSGQSASESQGLQFQPLQNLLSNLRGKSYQKENDVKTFPRSKLILIRRSGSRRFTEQSQIEAVVSKAAADFNLTYELFKDNPTPSLNDTMLLFHSAVMIVAPHGAGLANIVFSQPGTYIIEGVCNTPHINLCFHRTAVLLGHHWHGIPSRGGCEGVVDVAATSIDTTMRSYLSGRTRN